MVKILAISDVHGEENENLYTYLNRFISSCKSAFIPILKRLQRLVLKKNPVKKGEYSKYFITFAFDLSKERNENEEVINDCIHAYDHSHGGLRPETGRDKVR